MTVKEFGYKKDKVMKFPCSGVILAGGLNSRFSGKSKAFLSVNGRQILDYIYEVFREVFDEIILVANDPVQYLEWDIDIVTDIFPVRSSLTGIHAGLFYCKNHYAFFSACDTPFLKKQLVKAIVDEITPEYDVLVPQTSAGFEPLCAVYSKKCLHPVERLILKQDLKIQSVFKSVRVSGLSENMLRKHDPKLASFFNINTPDDLAGACKYES